MTKRYQLIIALIFLLTIRGLGQIQYQHTHYAAVDSSYIYSRVNVVDLMGLAFDYTGENMVWNYSEMEIAEQNEEWFVGPNQSGYFESFMFTCVASGGNYIGCLAQWATLSNMALKSEQDFSLAEAEISDYTEFQKKSNNKVETTMIGITAQVGGNSAPLTIPFSQPDVNYVFPIAYQNADSSNSGFYINLEPFGYDLSARRTQKRVNMVDGRGSLATPYTSFPQTLRMFTTIEVTDSVIYQGDTVALHRTELLIQWFSPLFGQPVLKVHGLRTEAGDVIHTVDFIDSLRCLPPSSGFFYYPVAPVLHPSDRMVDIQFINTSTNATHYAWDFGDTDSGSSNTSSLKNPMHAYTKGGEYSVTLAVRNEQCTPVTYDTLALLLFVTDTADVTAAFTHTPDIGCHGDNIFFTSQSQNAYNFHWDFGDGNTSSLQNPSHKYNESGTYTVSLTASNTTKSDEITHEVIVYPITQADAGNDTTIVRGESVTLQGSGGDFLSQYVWDESEYLSCTDCQNPVATPLETTTFFLTVSDPCNESRDSVVIYVTPPVSSPAITEGSSLSIFPNPNGGQFRISLPHSISERAVITISNTIGQEIFRSEYAMSGEQEIAVWAHHLPRGFYIVTLNSGDRYWNAKLRVER